MSSTLDSLDLPLDLQWIDRFDFTPIQQSTSRSLSGALIIQTATKLAGRTITLASSADYGWATQAEVDALFAKLTIATPLTLVLPDASTFSVRFRHEEQPIVAKPVEAYRVMADGDFYELTLKLITV